MENKNQIGWITAKVTPDKNGNAPESVELFPAGEGRLKTGEKYLVDKVAFDQIAASFDRGGTDIVIDYEHQTQTGQQAPAAGWISKLKWDNGVRAIVAWTAKAAAMIAEKEYRYHSPVFFVRKSDHRVIGVHSVALTNSPKTMNMAPLVAKLQATEKISTQVDVRANNYSPLQDKNKTQKEEQMLKKLIAKFKLAEDATEEAVMTAIDEAIKKEPETREIVAKDILTVLDLKDDADVSAVVAGINVLKQEPKGMVSREEHNALVAKMTQRDADEAVALAVSAGKILPTQKDWAEDYAKKDLAGFEKFIAKAAVVVPIKPLGEKKEDGGPQIDDAVMHVAKMFGNTEEDLKKYGGIDADA